jgi:D-alanine-D-alanine ligase
MLEVLGIPYLGSKVFASACGINKIFQKQLLSMHGNNVPKDLVLTPQQIKTLSLQEIIAKMKQTKISFPCVVKPVFEGSSLGISVVEKENDLITALQKACWEEVTRKQPVIIEEKIEGMEFTAIGLEANEKLNLPAKGNKWLVLPITEVIHEEGTLFHDYEQKYMPGRSAKITPARCSKKDSVAIQKTCTRVANVLNFSTFFRTDGFLSKDNEVIIVDPNTLSGMGPASFLFHQAAEMGMNHTHLINYLVNCELDKYKLLDEIILLQSHDKGASVSSNDGVPTKRRVAVLLGGNSNEREISLESGRNVCYKLSPSKYEVLPIFVDDQMRLYKLSPRLLIQNSTREITEQVTQEIEIKWADLPTISDFVFNALHGGKGEDGSVQGTLEMLGLPYNGPGVLASSLCMDKYRTNNFLKERGFYVPKSFLIAKEAWQEAVDSISKDLTFPLIVKPHDDGCSMYVKKINDKAELLNELKSYFTTEKKVVLIEECVAGMELTCGVLGNEEDEIIVFPPSQAVAVDGVLSIEEKFLPGAGENQTPAPLPKKTLSFVQDIVKQAYVELKCNGYSRIDCFYQDEKTSQTGKERVVILEVNTLPGLTPATCLFHQAAEIGMKPMELIDIIVELGVKSQRAQKIETAAILFFF